MLCKIEKLYQGEGSYFSEIGNDLQILGKTGINAFVFTLNSTSVSVNSAPRSFSLSRQRDDDISDIIAVS